MKFGMWRMSPLALLLVASIGQAERLEQACDLKPSISNCPSVQHYMNRPFEAKDDFEKYKLCSEANFDLYKVEKNCEFDAYLAKAEKSFNQYKKDVAKVWDKPEFSDKNSWISYTPSLKMKREVNFEKNVIKVTTIEGETTTVEELKEEIVSTSKLSIGSAQKQDKFTSELIEATKVRQLSKASFLPLSENKSTNKKELSKALENVKITKTKDSNGNEVVSAEISFPSAWLTRKEKRFIDSVETYSKKYQLEPEFVLSIIRTESAFDPRAVSHVPAFGLMQIVPSSAGLDATDYLFGKQQLLKRDYLFDPDKNIEVGTTYLHLLKNRYFKGIENSDSMKYCVIAAYNGGMGPIYRIFGKGKTSAINNINALSPQEVFDKIQKKHAAAETRTYLKRVHSAELKYQNNMI